MNQPNSNPPTYYATTNTITYQTQPIPKPYPVQQTAVQVPQMIPPGQQPLPQGKHTRYCCGFSYTPRQARIIVAIIIILVATRIIYWFIRIFLLE